MTPPMVKEPMKILFYGSSNYCLPILEVLNNNFHLVAVITKSDSLPHSFCLSHNIKVFTPKDKKELLHLKNQITQLKPDLAVVADYGLLIPKEIFSIPRYRTLNIHFSLLPKLRGPAPVQYTILLGEEKAGISVIIMDEDLDTGDIVWQKEIISFNSQHLTINNETSESLYQKLFNIAASELPDVIDKYVNNELKPQKQDNSLATYTRHFTREDGFIPSSILDMAIQGINSDQKKLKLWSLSSILLPISDTNASDHSHPYQLVELIDRALRALSPWPGLWTEITLPDIKPMTNPRDRLHLSSSIKKRLKILAAHLAYPKPYILNPIPYLIPDLVQLEGKKPVSWKQFLLGYPGIFTNNKN